MENFVQSKEFTTTGADAVFEVRQNQSYTLEEKNAPSGYTKADNLTFFVESGCTTKKVIMIDHKSGEDKSDIKLDKVTFNQANNWAHKLTTDDKISFSGGEILCWKGIAYYNYEKDDSLTYNIENSKRDEYNKADSTELNNAPDPMEFLNKHLKDENSDKKAADYMGNYNIRAALVSTNSITQGESVSILWKPLFESGVHIDFAYRTFIWDSEASIKAHVHCVIVGFSRAVNNKQKIIYSGENAIPANNINGYLLDAENIFIEKRMKPLCNVPEIALGGQAIDGGFLILTEEEKEEFLEKEPQASPFFRHYMMGKDFIDRKPRYCIWLVGADPGLLKKCPMILERVNKVREFRLSSTRANTKKAAENPTLFASILEHKNQYIAIPKVSSQNRRYIPMDYLDGEIIPGDKLFTMPNASFYEFGVLMSNVHMAWMRAVCGRLKSDYSYSNTIVYNNFPWPVVTEKNREQIEKSAQEILKARTLYPNSNLAALYDPLTMPAELRRAHTANDKAVMAAYGFSTKMTEADCVGELMKLYQKMQ